MTPAWNVPNVFLINIVIIFYRFIFIQPRRLRTECLLETERTEMYHYIYTWGEGWDWQKPIRGVRWLHWQTSRVKRTENIKRQPLSAFAFSEDFYALAVSVKLTVLRVYVARRTFCTTNVTCLGGYATRQELDDRDHCTPSAVRWVPYEYTINYRRPNVYAYVFNFIRRLLKFLLPRKKKIIIRFEWNRNLKIVGTEILWQRMTDFVAVIRI
jgi:hypothetical protein